MEASLRGLALPTLAPAAVRTFCTISSARSLKLEARFLVGLDTKSTAPKASALMVSAAPFWVREDIITTGGGVGGDKLFKKGETVHLGHLYVQGDDVRAVFQKLVPGEIGIGRGAHHPHVRLGLQGLAQKLAHHGGIVDHQNLYGFIDHLQ